MTICLATRGYLCNLRGIPVPVPSVDGPTLTVTEQVPDVVKAKTRRPSAPRIREATTTKPEIRGATESPPATQPSPPSGGAKTVVPTIRKVKKD